MIDRLIFSTGDISNSHSVGAFVISKDAEIDHQTINSEEWLNTAAILHDDTGTVISDSNPLAVSVKDGINVEVDLDHADDSVRLGDGTNLTTVTQNGAKYGLDVNIINDNITVIATDLDIRDLTQSDEITVYQGTSPWIISATDLDIRNLSQTQDNIQSWLYDSAGNGLTSTLVGSDQALDVNLVNDVSVNDAALANSSIASKARALAVANTTESLVASALSDRKYLFAYNNDNKVMYIGSAGMTAATGFPISPGSYVKLRAGNAIDVQWVSSKANHDARTLELS